MFGKKFISGFFCGLIALITSGCILFPAKKEPETLLQTVPVEEQPKTVTAGQKPVENPVTTVNQPSASKKWVKKADLYNSTDKLLPLSAIVDLAYLPEQVGFGVNQILENSSNGIYFLKQVNDKVIVIVDTASHDEENSHRRHDFEIIELSAADGSVLDRDNYASDSSAKKIKEFWNDSENDSVKYKMTDKNGNVISIRKETVDNQTNLREEHIFYDLEGNVKMNLSFNYDGADLKRFTFYDSENPEECAMIVNDYENGVKIKETLYSSDYKIKNIYVPEYKDGEKISITVLNSGNKELERLEN